MLKRSLAGQELTFACYIGCFRHDLSKKMKPLLEGESVYLRGLTEDARQYLHKWKNSPKFKRLTGPFLSIMAADLDLDLFLPDLDSTIQFAVCKKGRSEPIGWIALTKIVWSNRLAELSVFIGGVANQSEELGIDAIRLLLAYAFNEPNLHRVELEVVAYNERAIRAYRRLGFIQEGTKREYGEHDRSRYDLLQFGMLATEYQNS